MGQVFAGRYELLEHVADGGMGSVWLVRDLRDGPVLAAKVLRQVDASGLMRFMREQSVRIDHPHVVTPLSWAGEDDRVLFTMPLVRGGSVAGLIGDHGPLPEHWVVELLAQLLDALGAVHDAGVVHRDVKPANLLLEPTGDGRPHLRLTDFGIAVPVGQPRLTRVPGAVGSHGYMSPEQVAGLEPHPCQDLYAVGVAGLEMLTALPPPHVADALPDTPLVRLLLEATDPDPVRRPPSAAELRRRLLALPATPADWSGDDITVFDHFATPPTAPAGQAADRPGALVLPALMVAGGLVLLAVALWALLSPG